MTSLRKCGTHRVLPAHGRCPRNRLRLTAYLLPLVLAGPVSVLADSVAYRSVGAHGEVAFSDIPTAAATKVALTEFGQSAPTSAEQVALMLQVADELAQARHVREVARAEKRKQAEQTRRRQEEADRWQQWQALADSNRHPYYYPAYPWRRHKPRHPMRPYPDPRPLPHKGHPGGHQAPREVKAARIVLPQ